MKTSQYAPKNPIPSANCFNNCGPYFFPEKTMPLVIHNALTKKPLPIYGDGQTYRTQITFVKDRHYSIDASWVEKELGWKSLEAFEIGINKTVKRYPDNQDWVSNVISGVYRAIGLISNTRYENSFTG